MKQYNEFSKPFKNIQFKFYSLGFFSIVCNISYFLTFITFIYPTFGLIFQFDSVTFLPFTFFMMISFFLNSIYNKTRPSTCIDFEKNLIRFTNKVDSCIPFNEVKLLTVLVSSNWFVKRYVIGALYDYNNSSCVLGNGSLDFYYGKGEIENLNDINMLVELAAEKIGCDFIPGALDGKAIISKNNYYLTNNYKILNDNLNNFFNRKVKYYLFINAAIDIIIFLVIKLKGSEIMSNISHLPNMLGF